MCRINQIDTRVIYLWKWVRGQALCQYFLQAISCIHCPTEPSARVKMRLGFWIAQRQTVIFLCRCSHVPHSTSFPSTYPNPFDRWHEYCLNHWKCLPQSHKTKFILSLCRDSIASMWVNDRGLYGTMCESSCNDAWTLVRMRAVELKATTFMNECIKCSVDVSTAMQLGMRTYEPTLSLV